MRPRSFFLPRPTSSPVRVVPLLVLALALAGCASPGAAQPERWTFTERIGEEDPHNLGETSSFFTAQNLTANASMRQLGGQWHGALPVEQTFLMRLDASVDMRVSFRVHDRSGAAGSGTCDWPADSRVEKTIGVGRVNMRSTNQTCEITFTPTIPVSDETEPTLRWEARSAVAQGAGWALRFDVISPDT